MLLNFRFFIVDNLGINGERKLMGLPASPGSPGRMTVKTVCACVNDVCVCVCVCYC